MELTDLVHESDQLIFIASSSYFKLWQSLDSSKFAATFSAIEKRLIRNEIQFTTSPCNHDLTNYNLQTGKM